MPTDYTRQVAARSFHARHEEADPKSPPVEIAFAGEYFWSPTKPEHRFGEFGRIYAATFGSTPEATRYVINVESIFHLPPDHDNDGPRRALDEEARFVLESMRYRLA